jgi:indole-3-glycerol phosphate synthase
LSGRRHFSQAISEGDGISIVVPVDGPEAAASAESSGAEALVAETEATLAAIRGASELPILWLDEGEPGELQAAGADAVVFWCERWGGGEEVAGRIAEASELGLDCLVEVRDEDELERALERIDPEILLLAPARGRPLAERLERILTLVPDIPAGKLAVARLDGSPSRDQVDELERAGMDAVIVGAGDVGAIAGDRPSS